MERLRAISMKRRELAVAEGEERCLHCGHRVPERARGCKGGHCDNCGHPYPLGDCSD